MAEPFFSVGDCVYVDDEPCGVCGTFTVLEIVDQGDDAVDRYRYGYRIDDSDYLAYEFFMMPERD